MSKNKPPKPWVNHVEPEKSDDKKHCVALHHEFLSCEDAYNDFISLTGRKIVNSNQLAYIRYNAYSRFILHLYEFLIGATKREIGLEIVKEYDGNKSIFSFRRNIPYKNADIFIQDRTQILLSAYRKDIISGRIVGNPENYPEIVPSEFACCFRSYRNKVIGHVSIDRANLDLSNFYRNYHKYLMLHFDNGAAHWSINKLDKFPDLEKITQFNTAVDEYEG
jgi:hypothetical protein